MECDWEGPKRGLPGVKATFYFSSWRHSAYMWVKIHPTVLLGFVLIYIYVCILYFNKKFTENAYIEISRLLHWQSNLYKRISNFKTICIFFKKVANG